MSQIGAYTVLPLTMPSTPAYPEQTTHTIYLRPHAPKIPTEHDSRSLFLVNVPIDSTSAHLRAVFASLVGAGRYESVSFEHEKKSIPAATPLAKSTRAPNKKRKRGEEPIPLELPQIWDRQLHRSGSTAVVLLVDDKSVDSVLKAARKLHKPGRASSRPIWGSGITKDDTKVPALGSARYTSHQRLRYPPRSTLQRNVDAFMTAFNAAEEQKVHDAKRQRGVPDEDGFVTVTRGGRTGPARMADAERKRSEMEAKEAEKKSTMGDFYRFQMRERRKEEQGELVRRFEEDRRRVEEMRERRGRFRPEK
ncbi:meiotic recombination protein DMC1 [Diplocarpon rosae]|nr:meiotic recombination protein DMC1 [Diplocarpon rosae]